MGAGLENPAKSAKTDVISNRQSMPGVQMPGSRTKKVASQKAGQDVAGEANQVKITTGGSYQGKQTWKGAKEGYTCKTAPDFKGAKVDLNTAASGMAKKQTVKGKHLGRAPGESKSVAGTV